MGVLRHLGILAHSTGGAALCFLEFCEQGYRRTGRLEHPDVTLDYIAFGFTQAAWDAGDRGKVRTVLARSVRRLARAGADFFVCPDNTAHLALEADGPELALPGLHIVEVVAARAAALGYAKVGVLGTRYTMDGELYPRVLAAHGIEAVVPEPADRAIVNAIIFDELLHGVITEASRREYLRVIDDLARRGCTAVTLACTEIPLLITPEVSPLPTLDSTRLLALAGYEVAAGDRALPSWRGGPPR